MSDENSCDHAAAYIEPACCSFVSLDNPCACGGKDALICPDCGLHELSEAEVGALWERLA